jgi:hypothetical protein
LDWADLEQTLHDGVVRSVAAIVGDHPGERFYAAALSHLYREEDGPITLPLLGINSLEALAREPAEERADGTAQRWVAVALSRLGRLDLVLSQAESLPPDVVVSAVAAPYTSFRDHAVVAPPLDYRPLADFIEQRPAYLPALDQHLAPGNGFSAIAAHEVDAAVTGLNSPHVIIRRHAVAVLGRRRLGKSVGRRVLPLLCRTIRQDPDAVVRRLAILSMLWWRIDSRHLAEVVREALNDSAAEVRETAAYWLREQLADEPA